MKSRSEHEFYFVQVNQTYEPWHKWLSLPPCGSYLATSNISPNNKVNTWYNGQCSKQEHSSSSGWQIQQMDNAIHSPRSSSEWRPERLGGRKGPSVGLIAQHMIHKGVCSREKTWNALFKQRIETEMKQGFCGERNPSGKKASSRRRDHDYARAERYDYCRKRGGNNQKAWNNIWRGVERYWR